MKKRILVLAVEPIVPLAAAGLFAGIGFYISVSLHGSWLPFLAGFVLAVVAYVLAFQFVANGLLAQQGF